MWALRFVLGLLAVCPLVLGQAIPAIPQAPATQGQADQSSPQVPTVQGALPAGQQPSSGSGTGQGLNPGTPGAIQPPFPGAAQQQATTSFVPSAVPITDADICANSMPGQNGAPVASSGVGIFSFFLPSSTSGRSNPCVVQCRGYSGTWYAAKPWGSPCAVAGEQRYCADTVCVTRNDTYMDYCKQNLQTTGSMIAVTPYMCSLECMDPAAGIILKVRMKDGTPCRANTGRGYSNGMCYSGGCSIMTPSLSSNIFSGFGLFG
ncbi:uncharacterized protein LOC135370341 isoform X2 [Ornithodoros turicata]|uniref:uncharacterized protein LOC135370341 isoform X2 n=1 Tax=Ornithodoros turicata TaxID=34597 RepID=UPI0031393952